MGDRMEGGNPGYSAPLFILLDALLLPQSILRITELSCSQSWMILSPWRIVGIVGRCF